MLKPIFGQCCVYVCLVCCMFVEALTATAVGLMWLVDEAIALFLSLAFVSVAANWALLMMGQVSPAVGGLGPSRSRGFTGNRPQWTNVVICLICDLNDLSENWAIPWFFTMYNVGLPQKWEMGTRFSDQHCCHSLSRVNHCVTDRFLVLLFS